MVASSSPPNSLPLASLGRRDDEPMLEDSVLEFEKSGTSWSWSSPMGSPALGPKVMTAVRFASAADEEEDEEAEGMVEDVVDAWRVLEAMAIARRGFRAGAATGAGAGAAVGAVTDEQGFRWGGTAFTPSEGS